MSSTRGTAWYFLGVGIGLIGLVLTAGVLDLAAILVTTVITALAGVILVERVRSVRASSHSAQPIPEPIQEIALPVQFTPIVLEHARVRRES